jgi:phospholipid/cholesterol/gamma-HCH transport system ATP-binding protein
MPHRTPSGPPRSPPAADEIRVERVHKAFGSHPVLRGVDLVVRRGEMVAIVGGSGSGKTVLLQHMIGHLHPDRGRVLVADHETPGSPLRDLAELSESDMDRIRRHWAVVFQRNALLTGTVRENLSLWLREIHGLSDAEILPRARHVLEQVGLDPDLVMDLDRAALSGGMAKRVAIARALILEPVLILYDEPTSGLDPHFASTVHELIAATHARVCTLPDGSGAPLTSVIITHDTRLLERLRPRVVMLSDGVIGFDGDYESFVASDAPEIRPYLDQMGMLHTRSKPD